MGGEALMLCPEAPYPLTGGGQLRTASLLEWLLRRYQVDVLVFRVEGDEIPAIPGARSVTPIWIPRHSRRPAARVFRNSLRLLRGSPPLVDRFSGFTLRPPRPRYDLAVLEHFWCAPYRGAIPADRYLLDLHNVESVWHDRGAAVAAAPEAWAHRRFARRCRALERQWLPRFDAILTASRDDAEACGDERAVVYPNAIPAAWIRDPQPAAGASPSLAFSGNFEYAPNRDAVRWFASAIWPMLRQARPGLVWRLVGKGSEFVARDIAGDPGIVCTGPVGDAVAEIAQSTLAVVPLRVGSGTRLKILEAWAAGVPVVSTPLGAEGLRARDGFHLVLASDPKSFASSVLHLLADYEKRRTLAANAQTLLSREFTWEAAWSKLDCSESRWRALPGHYTG